MNFDINSIVSCLALAISLATIVFTKRDLKKQLRLAKLEEILENLHFLKGYYPGLFMLYVDTKELSNYPINEGLPEYLRELPTSRQRYIESINKEVFISKISRTKVLSNAYLSEINNLKSKIDTITDIYYQMYVYVYSNGEKRLNHEDLIIPRRAEMQRFLDKLEDDIIKEMKLGYNRIDYNKKIDYYKNQFKNDLKSK